MDKPPLLNMWTIYFDPWDHPHKWVVRRWCVTSAGSQPSDECFVCETLEQARGVIPPLLYNIGRANLDDPVVVETWL